MKNSFVLPSCNYNLVLSEDDLKQILDGKHVLIRPDKTTGVFTDKFGNVSNTSGHGLIYCSDDEYPVQYVTIGLER